MKKFIIQTILLGLFMVFSQSSAVYAQSCQMPDGTQKEISCNVYLDQLYSACAAPDEIADAQSGKCVPIVAFKRPLMGCFEDQCDIATSYPGYSPLALTSDLASFKLEGYLNAETVVIFLQGGPDDSVADDYFQFLEEDALVANVLQTNVAKMGIVKASDMTVEDARLEQQENLRLIHTAYTAIRAQFPEKRIVLAGHSMGAFLTLGYLAEYGNNFDRVVAMAGRVDLPLDFVRRFAIGQNFIFDHVGDVSRYEETREVRGVHKFSPYLRTAYSPNAESTLLAAVGLPRYSKLLENTDLSNMLYLYSARDEQVGGLNSQEIGLLEDQGAIVEEAGWHPDILGHSIMLVDPKHLQRIREFVLDASK